MLKRFLWAGLVAVLSVAVVGTSAATTGKGDASKARAQVLRIAIGSEPPSLDPGLATDTTSANIIYNIMEPLVKLGPLPKLRPIPTAAASWRVRGANVTINLRRNVRWSNGKPVTAQDYVWSWLRTISPELGADYAYQFFGIKGAEAYNSCKSNCGALRAKVGVKAAGRYTLRVQLTSPQPWFVQQLSHHSFLPVHRATVEKYGNKWTEPANIVTDGPFKLAAWRHDASLTLVKNTKWRNAKSVRLNRIEHSIIVDGGTAANAFQAGNVDVNSNTLPAADVPKWRKTGLLKIYKALGTYYYGFNVKNITDVNQRRAMAFAIDRYQITKYITQTGQVPAKGFTPPGITGGPTIVKHAFLPARAQRAKARAFMAKVRNPKKAIKLYMNNAPNHVKIATAVQAFWKELGLDVTLRVIEWKQYLQFLGPPPPSDVDVYRLGWIYDFPDAYNGLVLWTCDSGNNNTNWCNKKFDGLLDKATKTSSDARRTLIYQQAEDLISSPKGQLPIMPIYWYTFQALVKNYVKGFFINVQDNWDYTKVSMR
ncbi:MAG TPA: peptide ABC transporter substrate-binding protein [Gaiellaceae bacterium]|nr:peptide ABC transporter substrate-binding protein [Gaiellaceae bacterium]